MFLSRQLRAMSVQHEVCLLPWWWFRFPLVVKRASPGGVFEFPWWCFSCPRKAAIRVGRAMRGLSKER